MRKLIWVLGLAVASALAAQDSGGPPRPSPDSAERGRLQQEIERRFGQRVQQEHGLTDVQAGKLRATEERYRARRREIVRRQLGLRFALQDQMRPGQAADADSVRRLMDGMQANRGELFTIERDQDREMAGYLTPVQRAQYQMIRERLTRRLAEIRRQRGMAGGEGQGLRPRQGPRRRPRP